VPAGSGRGAAVAVAAATSPAARTAVTARRRMDLCTTNPLVERLPMGRV